MVVRCEDVWREMSSYIEGELDPDRHAALEEHIGECKRCTAVLAGTLNIVALYGDERMCEVPLGFSQRLQQRLEENMPRRRGTALGWTVAFAFAALVIVSFQVGNSSPFRHPPLRSLHAQPARHIPPTLEVVVENSGKLFHLAGCPFIHKEGGVRTVTAEEAMREGYSPCVRCLQKYLETTRGSTPQTGDDAASTEDLSENEKAETPR